MDSNTPTIANGAPRTLAAFLHDLLLVNWSKLDVESAESLVLIDLATGMVKVHGAPRRVERDGLHWLIKL